LTHQENYTKLCEKHHKEQIEVLTQKMQEEEIRNFETERIEIIELCHEQGLSEEEREDFLALIELIAEESKENHLIQLKELKTVQNEDLIALKREQKRYRQEVKRTAPDTILYVYAKTKKEKERKKTEKRLQESRSKGDVTASDPEHHIVPSSPGGPTRSTSAMMMNKKKKMKEKPPPLKPAATDTEQKEQKEPKIRHSKTRSQKPAESVERPSPRKHKRSEILLPTLVQENGTEHHSDPEDKVKTPNGEPETEELTKQLTPKINEDNTQI